MSRIASRVITGPVAFLLAGLIDVAVFGLRALGGRN